MRKTLVYLCIGCSESFSAPHGVGAVAVVAVVAVVADVAVVAAAVVVKTINQQTAVDQSSNGPTNSQ